MVEVRNLSKFFPVKRGFLRRTVAHVRAVDDLSFSIPLQGALALVGESGCGKTTVGRCLVRLDAPTDGQILFDGNDIAQLNEKEFSPYRTRMQYVFQDPYSSLNPRMSVAATLSEPLRVHHMKDPKKIKEKVAAVLEQVGLSGDALNKYPHEFSGGQRQRICIARALVLDPEFFVLDEPVASLDVSIQAQILNLLQELRVKRSLTYLFISHNLSVVRQVTDMIAVMYLGKIVEIGKTEDVFTQPQHPYTRSLLASVPGLGREVTVLEGEIPSNITPPTGCHFLSRCSLEKCDACKERMPSLLGAETDSPHKWACHVSGR